MLVIFVIIEIERATRSARQVFVSFPQMTASAEFCLKRESISETRLNA
jgi:hypothetical protein